MSHIVLNGDNIEVLKKYSDNYFDAVVTDPPYGLGKEPNAEDVMKGWIEKGYHEVGGSGFMGKEWDAFIPQPIFWKEVFRVLKHGGHVLAFYGTRTYDWGVMAMRFAGFEVRDTIYWHYGSGFPKSHNIGKAIDKMKTFNVQEVREFLRKELKDIDKSTLCNELGITSRQIDHWIKENESQPQIPSKDKWELLKKYFTKDVPNINWENLGKIIDEVHNPITWYDGDKYIREATTKEAKQWEGWGSALKPASEPIVMARKPLEKGLSIAENVLKYGNGAINIDASRITLTDKDNKDNCRVINRNIIESEDGWGMQDNKADRVEVLSNIGRFPANIILTHHEECECKGLKKVKGMIDKPTNRYRFGFGDAEGNETIEDWDCHENCPIKIMDEQSGISKSGDIKPHEEKGTGTIYGNGKGFFSNMNIRDVNLKGDKGGASRFFYCAKASKSERNKGLDGFEAKQTIGGGGTYNKEAGAKYGSIKAEGKNFHPTVKPIKLMQYLVKMITPPNGVVLDPFCGSGTTGIACKLEGFKFVGIEQDAEYTKIAQARIENYQEEPLEPLELIKEDSKGNTVTQKSLF